MGAMTIVELIDIHNGFDIITKRIKTTKSSTLLFQIGVATFFLSAVLDNLATTIVMCSLISKRYFNFLTNICMRPWIRRYIRITMQSALRNNDVQCA